MAVKSEDKIMEDKMFFGKKLRKLRLDKKIGLRKMSEQLAMKPSEYCDIEHGYVEPPSIEVLSDIYLILDLISTDEGYDELLQLHKQPFVMQKMPVGGIPVFPITTDGKSLSDEGMKDLHNYIQTYMEDHNDKADAYNKEHGVA